MRKARLYVWVNPQDCDPPHSLDLSSAHDWKKVAQLVEAFELAGFDKTKSALVGYPLNGKIQLLSGTHRHAAALATNTQLPVKIVLRSDVEDKWGTHEWSTLIADVPVNDLEDVEIDSRIVCNAVHDLSKRVEPWRDFK